MTTTLRIDASKAGSKTFEFGLDSACTSKVSVEAFYADAFAFAPGAMRAPGPVIVADPSQAYYWTEIWQSREAEADADIAAGNMNHYASMDDALAALAQL